MLVQVGAGGVGSFAVQIAESQGARVTTTALPQDRDFVTRLGADRVVDYSTGRFEDQVADVGAVFDAVGGETQARSWAVLRPGGTLVSFVQPPDPDATTDGTARGVFFVVEPDRAGLEAITELIDDGRLAPAVDRVVPLAETPAAYEALGKEHRRGKIVLHVGDGA